MLNLGLNTGRDKFHLCDHKAMRIFFLIRDGSCMFITMVILYNVHLCSIKVQAFYEGHKHFKLSST